MALTNLPPHSDHVRLHPVAPHGVALFCLALLTVSCALASFALACATPFAAFAVVAAAALSQRQALLVVTATWLANQCIGFGALHYPLDAGTIGWGLVIGAAALVATAAASTMLRILTKLRTPLALAIALVAAYAAYELALFAATPFLGGQGAFTAAIVSRIGLTCAMWLAGLVAVCEVARLIGSLGRGRATA
ncbi:hypothetical protein ACNJX9_20555 [Bradyrhizobium sp. DASA03076]|uniref:hypothetical protein n=1 Tax=Bradyrhizobium sp. BLXBL-03 TaxID=3395916 RepID=UPI003F6FD154